MNKNKLKVVVILVLLCALNFLPILEAWKFGSGKGKSSRWGSLGRGRFSKQSKNAPATKPKPPASANSRPIGWNVNGPGGAKPPYGAGHPQGGFQRGGVAPAVNYAPAPSFPVSAIPAGAYKPQSSGIGLGGIAAGVGSGLLAGAAGAAIYNALKPEDRAIYRDREGAAPGPAPTTANVGNVPPVSNPNKQYYPPPGQYYPATGQYVPPGEYDNATGVFTPGRYIPGTSIFQQGQYDPLTQIFTPGFYDPASGKFALDPNNGPVNLGVALGTGQLLNQDPNGSHCTVATRMKELMLIAITPTVFAAILRY